MVLTDLSLLVDLLSSGTQEWLLWALLSIVTIADVSNLTIKRYICRVGRMDDYVLYLLENLFQVAHSSELLDQITALGDVGVSHGAGLARLLLSNVSSTDYLLVSHIYYLTTSR